MIARNRTYRILTLVLLCIFQLVGNDLFAQLPRATLKRKGAIPDSTIVRRDSIPTGSHLSKSQILELDSLNQEPDSLVRLSGPKKPQRFENLADTLKQIVPPQKWIPDPVKATWMALVIPGGGQIYNRKYWKLPIFYGGFAGCAYALDWNRRMYKDYTQAYKDAVNENWKATSITSLIPEGYIDRIDKTQLTKVLKNRKDRFRRYRDLSIFAFIAVYALSVVDAYVDAELSNFDIGPDLSLHVEPALMKKVNGVQNNSVGLLCSFSF